MTIPRRLISEIRTRYALEPELDDIYVEGRYDKLILDTAFKSVGIDRPVYEIDTIDVPFDMLESLGLTRGKKQQVIAACLTLDLPSGSNVRFLVDKDFDDHLNKVIKKPLLIYTPHCSLVGCLLDSDCLYQVVTKFVCIDDALWPRIEEEVAQILTSIFCIRISMEELEYSHAIPSFVKSILKFDDGIIFEASHLISRCNSLPAPRAEILDRVSQWYEKLNRYELTDRFCDHDLFNLIRWMSRHYRGDQNAAAGVENLFVLFSHQTPASIVNIFYQ